MKQHRPRSSFDLALLSVVALAPAALAAAGALAVPDAAHDAGVLRTVGVGYTGLCRALDLLVAAPFLALPFGTRALRAALASAAVAGLAGALAFEVARDVLHAALPAALRRLGIARGMDKPALRLASAVAGAAVLAALLGPAWQVEASAPGGAVVGAALVLSALWLARSGPASVPAPALALTLGLALAEGPTVFLGALVAAAPAWRELRKVGAHGAIAFSLGLLPLALGALLVHRAPELADPGATLLPSFARHASPLAVLGLLGKPALLFAAVGAALGLLGERHRSGHLLAVAAAGIAAVALGEPLGAGEAGPVALVAVVALHVLAAITFGVVVLAIARARVPLAEWSAALVVVIELVMPLGALDQTSAERAQRTPGATSIWNDVAWGAAPPAAAVLVADRATMRRVHVTRALGELRADLVFVPQYDVQGRAGQHALLAEPRLASLYRDVALGVPPEELSLAQLGAQRTVLATFDPTWERALARHLVPLGLVARFEQEPRGPSDRKRALEAFAPARTRLAGLHDPALAAATTVLLRARSVGMAATGERELLSQSLDDLRAFAPDDATGTLLVRRLVTTKGAIDVHDLGGRS